MNSWKCVFCSKYVALQGGATIVILKNRDFQKIYPHDILMYHAMHGGGGAHDYFSRVLYDLCGTPMRLCMPYNDHIVMI